MHIFDFLDITVEELAELSPNDRLVYLARIIGARKHINALLAEFEQDVETLENMFA
jgi:hypothetical protein